MATITMITDRVAEEEVLATEAAEEIVTVSGKKLNSSSSTRKRETFIF
jgi:hypothetical protein